MCGCLKGATLNFFMSFGCVEGCLGLDKIDYIYLLFIYCLWFGWFVGLCGFDCVCGGYIFMDWFSVSGTAESAEYYIWYKIYFV